MSAPMNLDIRMLEGAVPQSHEQEVVSALRLVRARCGEDADTVASMLGIHPTDT